MRTIITPVMIVMLGLAGMLISPVVSGAGGHVGSRQTAYPIGATPASWSGKVSQARQSAQVTQTVRPATTSPAPAAAGTQGYTAVTPFRIADTRPNSGCTNVTPSGTLGPDATVVLKVVGAVPCEGTSGSVPSNATAIVMNVTVTGGTAGGFLTVFPAETTRTTASNLNWTTGQVVSNLVTVQLGTNGTVDIYSGSDGSVNVVADLQGYYGPASSTSGAGNYQPLSPHRICDTRPANVSGLTDQCTGHAPGPGNVLTVQVAGHGTLPVTGISAVVLNVTAVTPSNSGYLTVYPAGVSRPTTSNLNFVPDQTVPNRVMVGLGTNGAIDVYNFSGTTNVIVDVTGYFTDSTVSAASGSLFQAIPPKRICDTRPANVSGLTDQCTGRTLVANQSSQTLAIQVAGMGGVPASTSTTPPTAVVMNVTITGATASSYLTVYPATSSSTTPPTVSDLNWKPGATLANLVVATMAPGGTVDIYNYSGSVDVVVDVLGYFTAASTTWTEALPATPIDGAAPLSGAPAGTFLEYAQAAYDASTNEVVLFGGTWGSGGGPNTTWTWNGSSWQQQSSATSPQGRYGAAIAYDPANQTVVMFGGYLSCGTCVGSSNSTWIWNGTNWVKPSPATSPSPGSYEAMVFDQALGEIVLYTDSGNTWTWNGNTWTELSPASSPGALCMESMAYDPSSQTVLLFGGGDNSGNVPVNATCAGPGFPALDSTWSFNGTTWTKLSPSTSPPSRFSAAMAYDPNTSQVVLFGGCDGINGSTGLCNALTDTWTWDGSNWTQATPQSSPPTDPGGQGTNGMVWDAGSDLMVMLGYYGSTWQYPTF
ncbi:MAG: hypothetical protein M1399_07390 [Actinobacteria bacterium]|nr:hypothetical protein [Actinomycetota bacterium]MCL5446648.1 hypothetical protein [Actinomycetota bacterium]